MAEPQLKLCCQFSKMRHREIAMGCSLKLAATIQLHFDLSYLLLVVHVKESDDRAESSYSPRKDVENFDRRGTRGLVRSEHRGPPRCNGSSAAKDLDLFKGNLVLNQKQKFRRSVLSGGDLYEAE